MSQPKVGVVLAGCGVMDGSEIHEAVITLLEIARAGAEAVAMAPDGAQRDVVDHIAHEPAGETRDILVESARIARGTIRPIREVRAAEIDALVLPGGYGAAKNLCDFAVAGAACAVQPDLERLILEMHAAKKPIGAICIAPVVLARVFGRAGVRVRLTIGDDAGTAAQILAMGAVHEQRRVDEVLVDPEHRIVTTPAYMLGPTILDVSRGIGLLVRELVGMIR